MIEHPPTSLVTPDTFTTKPGSNEGVGLGEEVGVDDVVGVGLGEALGVDDVVGVGLGEEVGAGVTSSPNALSG